MNKGVALFLVCFVLFLALVLYMETSIMNEQSKVCAERGGQYVNTRYTRLCLKRDLVIDMEERK